MTSLRVEAASGGVTLQDFGRFGWRRHGISTAGAMDRLALATANALVGNAPDQAGLEAMLGGCRLRVGERSVLVAAASPGVTLIIDSRVIPAGQSAEAAPGALITLAPPRGGVYGYLAIAGGVDLAGQMGSLSTHRRSGVGAAPIAVGDLLPLCGTPPGAQPLSFDRLPEHELGPIRVMAGPQDDWFGAEALARLCATDWRVAPRSDRMGLFLEGGALEARAGSMVTDGVMPGSIQVPPAGMPIVLMRDCQTTGGYPKIATVISADLDRLAQIGPGQRLRFALVSRDQALEALRAARARVAALRPGPAFRSPDTARLLRENLISGVWDGQPGEDLCQSDERMA